MEDFCIFAGTANASGYRPCAKYDLLCLARSCEKEKCPMWSEAVILEKYYENKLIIEEAELKRYYHYKE